MTKSNEEHLQGARQAFERDASAMNRSQLCVLEQMWLELARALAEQGVLDAEALAQRLEGHAQRAPDHTAWFYGLLTAAQLLRHGSSSDPDSLVQ